MSEEQTLVFKTREEKAKALLEVPDEPNGGVNDLEAWQEENRLKREKIEEAKIEDSPIDSPEPVEETVAPQEPVEPIPESETIAFNIKRDELPEILRPYKNADEIVKTAAHAREYANKIEKEMESLAIEKDNAKKELENARKEAERLKQQLESSIKTAPPSVQTSGAKNVLDELEGSIKKMELLDETEYATVGQTRSLFRDIAGQVKNAFGELSNIKEDIKRETDTLKTELGSFKSTAEQRQKEVEEQEKRGAFVTSLKSLQEKYPELKTNKPLTDSVNCVENDIHSFGKKILGGLYNNYDPKWENVIAVTNAYLKGHPDIKQYCDSNAITPESVGSSIQDIQNYSLINYIDKRANGCEILEDGQIKKMVNPFSGKDVSYKDHIDAYESFKRESGVADNEVKHLVAEAEKRYAQNLGKAMQRRATEAPTLGSMGEASPEDVGQEITKEEAMATLRIPGFEDKMEQEARMGNRSLFEKRNKALKRLGHDPFAADPNWPPEKKRG